MFGTSGEKGAFGELTGFPKTGTTMVWLDKRGREVQQGHYQGVRAATLASAYRTFGPWQYESDGWYVYGWPSYWRYWKI